MRKTITSIFIITAITLVTLRLTNAFFSDTETSTNNTLAAGSVDLLIDNSSYYNGELNDDTTWTLDNITDQLFFNFTDVKPNDWGEDTISIHVDDNDAWACMELSLTANDDNTCTEPEQQDDPNCTEPGEGEGELGGLINMVFWADDGDNVLEDDETENIFLEDTALNVLSAGIIPLAQPQQGRVLLDSDLNEDGALIGGETYYIGKAWCFGDLTVDPLGQNNEGAESNRTPANSTGGISCNGSGIDNAAQTDSLLADISFRAEQYRNNPDFTCEECLEEVFTTESEDNDQGTLKNGGLITDTNRTDPSEATGPPDWVPGTGTNFYSFGRNTNGDEGWIILKFASPVQDGPGDDLSVHEATNGRDTYPEESALVEISSDGTTWHEVGTASSEPGGGGDGVSLFDISSTPLSSFLYVRLTDTTNYGPHANDADGFDLDAVDAKYGQCEEPEE